MDLATAAFLLLGLPAILGALLYVVCLPWTARATSRGLRGRTYWGRRLEIAWPEVGEILFVPVEGMPSLRVGCKRTRKEMVLYTLGTEAHAGIVRLVGASHPLAKWIVLAR